MGTGSNMSFGRPARNLRIQGVVAALAAFELVVTGVLAGALGDNVRGTAELAAGTPGAARLECPCWRCDVNGSGLLSMGEFDPVSLL